MRVVDASVAAKWFLTEADSDLALALLDGGERLVAPVVIRTEVIGAILRACRDGHIDRPKARAALDAWARLLDGGLVSLVPEQEILGKAVDLAFSLRHPLPDCLYLAVAVQMDLGLVTADGPLHKRGSKVARVGLLADERVGRA